MGHHRFLPRAIRNCLNFDAPLARHPPCGRQAFQPVHRRAHHVVRVRRAEALRENVANTGALEHRADRTSCDHAGSRRRRLEQHAARAMLPDDFMRDRTARERHFGHVAARGLHRLAHGFADFVRLAGRDPDLALAVAHCDERVEAEAPAALHDLRHAVDRDDVFDHPVTFALPVAAITPFTTPAPTATTASATAPASAAAWSAPAPTTTARALRFRGSRWHVGGWWNIHRRRNVRRGHVRRRRGSLSRGHGFVFWIWHQNSNPPLRAPSATAFTRPWYG